MAGKFTKKHNMTITKEDKKLIEKYRKKVHTQFPKAFLSSRKGKYTIVQEQSDLTLKDVLSELCIPPQDTPVLAWQMAQVSAKTTQNFNRTHPLRVEVYDSEDKIARIEGRKLRSGNEKPSKSKKRSELDNYYIYD
jgi:hypothetical protein